MIHGEQHGFTIIEVTLFLAVSAMLLLVAFLFTSSTLKNARFTDTTKSLQSFLQEQYTRVQTNSLSLNTPVGKVPVCAASGPVAAVNSNEATGTSNCILLGAALDIAADKASISITPVLGYANSTNQTLSGVNPQLWSLAAETYTPAWQASIAKVVSVLMKDITNAANTDSNINRLLFVRNVQSESINFYATHTTTALTEALDASSTSNTRNVPTLVCVRSDDGGALRGAIQIKGSGTETSTNINMITSSVVAPTDMFFQGIALGFGGVSCN